MYILLKTNETKKIKILNNGQKAHYFYAKDLSEAKLLLNEIEDTENGNYWSKYYANPDLPRCKEFNEYLKQLIIEPNKLSNYEMQELCFEAQKWFPIEQTIQQTNYNICYSSPSHFHNPTFMDFKVIWKELVDIIDRYTQTKNNISDWDIEDNDFHPIKDLELKFHFRDMQEMYNKSLCGALNLRFYKLIYYFDFLGIKIENPRLREFWDFYKRTLNVYAIEAEVDSRHGYRFCLIPKPDEIFIKDETLHYAYGSDYYCDGLKVEKWLYVANRQGLKLSDFDKLKNVDYRSVFIKKAGIEKFIRRGEIIDTWENYPDNEWWAKSEYKLIDMRRIFLKYIRTSSSGRVLKSENYDYAPFLYMKNQTTGEYHLEGVSPDCKNLYDALKMRYNDLNLPVYEVKDIK